MAATTHSAPIIVTLAVRRMVAVAVLVLVAAFVWVVTVTPVASRELDPTDRPPAVTPASTEVLGNQSN